MKFIQCLQGTPEWLQARAGAITASRFSDATEVLKRASGDKKAGEPSAASLKYASDVAIERISGHPYGEPVKAWTLERGHEMEAKARILYEVQTGLMAIDGGIFKTDDDWFGYSSDGAVDLDGLIEIKAPVDTQKIVAMWQSGDVSEYAHQMQGGMWITGRQWCDFIMYVPDLARVGKDLFIKRVHRDDEFINDMVEKLMGFRSNVMFMESFFRKPVSVEQLRQAA